MTADEYKKQYEQQQQENQNRYYIAQKESQIEDLRRSIAVNNTWYDKLEQVRNNLLEYINATEEGRTQPGAEVVSSGNYDDWDAKKKTSFGDMMTTLCDVDIVNYLNSLRSVFDEINSKMTELKNKNSEIERQIDNLIYQINNLK